MFILKRLFCRTVQLGFRAVLPVLPYREPAIIHKCEDLKEILNKEEVDNVLIVTDKGIKNLGLLNPIEEALINSGIKYTVYDNTRANPTVGNIEEALAIYKKEGCKGIIAVGGGSSIDSAKALGARVVYPNRSVNKLGGLLRVWKRLPLLIAVPTTAGTGSETTLAAVITDENTHHKYAMMSFPLIPHYALLDPQMTYSLPASLTATTGMDALCHAIEAYIGRSTTKETRFYAKEASRLVFENIKDAYDNGYNILARENMLKAAYMAGISFSKSYVGYIHAIAHTLGGQYGTPHGLANAVIMPYILEDYGEAIYKKLYDLALVSHVCEKDDSYEVAAKKFIEAIKEMNHSPLNFV